MGATKNLKILVKQTIRFCRDLKSGDLFRFAKMPKKEINFPFKISISQEIKPSETFENKKFNLALSAKRINEYCLMPNEIFSFWKIIGNPNPGFKKGRSLENGVIKEEIGGGICQVSGILHHVSILAGLQIVERYNHSVDIYTEETRFAPLGSDATVVYGHKDLRLKNNYNFPIKFEIKVAGNQIKIDLLSTKKIEEIPIFFESEEDENFVKVKVLSENREIINISEYKKMK